MTDNYRGIGRADYCTGRRNGKKVCELTVTLNAPLEAKAMHKRTGGYMLGADRPPVDCHVCARGLLHWATFAVDGKRDAAALCKLIDAQRYNF